MELRHKTVKGISWTVTSQVSRLAITFAVMAVLAHLLNPGDFGLIAMVMVFTNLFNIVNDLGLSSAIIQKGGVTDEELSSAFWVNLLEGIVITLIFVTLAPLIASFYGKSALRPIIMVVSITFTISSIGMIQSALFAKRMDFRALAVIEIVASAASGGVAIALAASGFGVWSLVAQSLVSSFVLSLLLVLFVGWRPRFVVRWSSIRGLLAYGIPLMGFNFVNYLSRNLDNLLIGKYLGARQLGFYDIAYKLLLFPLGNVSVVIGRVMFPALSQIQEDKAKFRSAYTRATRYIGAITFPLMAGLMVLAPQLVKVFLGAKWDRSIFLIQVLALVGLVQSIISPVGWIYLSRKRTGVLFAYGAAVTVLCAASFVIGLHWNVEGVAVAYAIASAIVTYPALALPFSFIDMKFWHYARQFWTIAAATLGMAAVMTGLRFLFEKIIRIGNLPILVVLVIVGTVCYIGLLLLADRNLISGLIEVFREMKAGAPSPGEEG